MYISIDDQENDISTTLVSLLLAAGVRSGEHLGDITLPNVSDYFPVKTELADTAV